MHPARDTDLAQRLALALRGALDALSGIDPGRLATGIEYHGVEALLLTQVQMHGPGPLPASLVADLHQESHDQAALSLLRLAATRELLAGLLAGGIECMVLKGQALALLHYPQPGQRPCTDVDLWVRPTRLEATTALLAENGYRIPDAASGLPQLAATRELVTGVMLTFDVHALISNRSLFLQVLDFDACWHARQAIPELGNCAQALANRDLLLHACVHRIAQSRNAYANRLVWLYDLHLLATALGDAGLQETAEAALEKRIGVVVADGLARAREAFGTRLPDGLLPALTKCRADEPSAALLGASHWRWAWSDLVYREGIKAKISLLRETLANRFKR